MQIWHKDVKSMLVYYIMWRLKQVLLSTENACPPQSSYVCRHIVSFYVLKQSLFSTASV